MDMDTGTRSTDATEHHTDHHTDHHTGHDTGTAAAGDVEAALKGWRAALGEARVRTDGPTLAAWQRNTSEFAPRELVAVLRPAGVSDVRQIIEVARSTKVLLQPVSTGRNWGFGSALPPRGPAALVQLGDMDRILKVDGRLGYAVIEPGVTQGRLSDHLAALGGTLKINVTGSARETSLVGNVLDRGGGNLGARAADLLGLEVVLGNGEVVRTGLWHLDADTVHHYPPGLGPDLLGLFVQSGFGVVTKMALRLHPSRPLREVTVEVREPLLPDLVEELSAMCQDNLVTGYLRITDGADPNIRFFRASATPTWKAQLTLYGNAGMRAAAATEIEHRLSGLAESVQSFDTEHDDPAGCDEQERALLEARLQLADGVPSDRSLHNLAQTAGKAWTGAPGDLDHDRDLPGFLCLNVTLPFTGSHVVTCAELVRRTAEEMGVTCARLFGRIGPTALSGFFPFYFERTDPEAVARAHRFKDELLDRLEAAAIYPMRIDIDVAPAFLRRTDDGFWRSVSAIKRALDPQGVVASRYVPEPSPATTPESGEQE